MLNKFRTAKHAEIVRLKEMEAAGIFPAPLPGQRPGFAQALKMNGCAFIAEYKRASPSRGNINLALSPENCALDYANAGANALSVLTEETYFNGSLDYLFKMCGGYFPGGLRHNLPLLRKDFIFHPLQVRVTAATPASALLLIVRMLDMESLSMLLKLAESLGLESVVEVFDEADLELAMQSGAEIIQVNNRDLNTLKTDLSRSFKLVGQKRQNQVWISASGVARPEEAQNLHSAGFDAVLVGSSLMEKKSQGEALKYLRGNNA